MKKLFLILILFFFSNNINSQGFIWNAETKDHYKTYNRVQKSRSISIPSSFSLEKYLPYIQNQGQSDMCAAYSISTCRTIIYARNNEITDIDKISAESYSPYYIYERAKSAYGGSWDGGMNTYLDKINRFGYAKMKNVEYPYYYPFTNESLCNFSVPSYVNLNLEKVKKEKFDYIASILPTNNTKDTISDLTNQVKTELSQGRPIFFGMWPLPANWKFMHGEDSWVPLKQIYCNATNSDDEYLWCPNTTHDVSGLCPEHKPKNWEPTMGHAMILIGYDDEKNNGSFHIVNSWGENWGTNGKLWIKYEDFFKYAVGIQSLDKIKKTSIFDIDTSNNTFNNLSNIRGDGVETKDFINSINYKWMLRVPILGINDGKYSGEKKNQLRNGKGSYTLTNGIVYSGNWKDDKMHGEGKYSFNDFQYIGLFHNGDLHGEGIWTKINKWGDIIEEKKGLFKKGVFIEGYVKIDITRGLWRGCRYEGGFSNESFNGYGSLSSYKRNLEYLGEFKDGRVTGKGRLETQGCIYEGEFYKNVFHGNGSYTLSNGEKYIGEWKNGKKNGKGTYTYFNGNKYDGEWKDDRFHGEGVYTYKNGSIKEGRWIKGDFIGNNIVKQIDVFLNNILEKVFPE